MWPSIRGDLCTYIVAKSINANHLLVFPPTRMLSIKVGNLLFPGSTNIIPHKLILWLSSCIRNERVIIEGFCWISFLCTTLLNIDALCLLRHFKSQLALKPTLKSSTMLSKWWLHRKSNWQFLLQPSQPRCIVRWIAQFRLREISTAYPVDNEIALTKLKFIVPYQNCKFISLIRINRTAVCFEKTDASPECIERSLKKTSVRKKSLSYKIYPIFPQQSWLMKFIIRLC